MAHPGGFGAYGPTSSSPLQQFLAVPSTGAAPYYDAMTPYPVSSSSVASTFPPSTLPAAATPMPIFTYGWRPAPWALFGGEHAYNPPMPVYGGPPPAAALPPAPPTLVPSSPGGVGGYPFAPHPMHSLAPPPFASAAQGAGAYRFTSSGAVQLLTPALATGWDGVAPAAKMPPPPPSQPTMAIAGGAAPDPLGLPAMFTPPFARGSTQTPPLPPEEGGARQLIVNYLPPAATEAALHACFGRVGPLEKVVLARKGDGSLSGFAFVYYQDHSSAREAILRLDGAQWSTKHLRVEWSTQRGRAAPGEPGYRAPVRPAGYDPGARRPPTRPVPVTPPVVLPSPPSAHVGLDDAAGATKQPHAPAGQPLPVAGVLREHMQAP